MGKATLTSPPGYLPPTILSTLLMLCYCSITVAPSVLLSGGGGFPLWDSLCAPPVCLYLINTLEGGANGGIRSLTQSQGKEENK
jgi:hypothetical protein